jgi:hypothetical protein
MRSVWHIVRSMNMKASEKGSAIIRDVISDACGVKQTPAIGCLDEEI